MRFALFGCLASVLLATSTLAIDQSESAVTAFVDVAVVPMDRNEVVPHQTVIVHGDRIVRLGPAAVTNLPSRARRIDCKGLFLMPGLVDSHVHLETALGARPEFGDGPLFLAAGVTTVFNLRGSPEQLRWRSELEEGKIAGPNLYTSGEFINEPLEKTPEDIDREVQRQVREGYDLLKLHEIEDANFNYLTTTGLNRPAYHELIESARAHHIPLVGHIPTELGLPAALVEGQNLAHLGMYVLGYFVPVDTKAFHRSTTISVIGLVLVISWCLASFTISGIRRMLRKDSSSESERPLLPFRFLVLVYSILIFLLSAAYASLEWLGEDWRIDAITSLAALTVVVAGSAMVRLISVWKAGGSWKPRAQIVLLGCGVALYSSSLLYFVPLSWRSTTLEIKKIAAESKAAHIIVMTTLVVDHAPEMAQDPQLKLLSKTARKDWGVDDGSISNTPFLQRLLGGHMQGFQERLVNELYEHGVPLLLGTDTFGFPGVPPGTSVHKELELLHESGLPTYDTLRTATVNPAIFLGKRNEFGLIAVGARADLLLIEANPLANLQVVGRPLGVMVRGRWISRSDLQRMIHSLPQ